MKKTMNRFTRILSIILLSISFSGCKQQPNKEIYPTGISISGPDSVTKNETIQLSVDFEPFDTTKRNVVWSINNDKVAAIDQTGLLTGKEIGKVKVTAKSADRENVFAYFNVEVLSELIPVTSVTLDKTNITLFANQESLQLNATVLPHDASDKTLTWSTSDSSIVDVSNSGVVTAKNVGNANISVTTKDGGYVASCAVNVVEQPKANWTIMVYMCGADLESNHNYRLATSDLTEILSVDNQPDDVNIIIETGGAKSWAPTYKIDKNYLQRWHVKNKELVLDASITKANMGKSETFQSFLEWGLTEYPAKKTGVILWNHGGAMKGVCFDENYYDDSLLNSEVKSALEKAFIKTNQTKKLEFIGYDACLMQMQDIAEFNSLFFNYMIGSQESETGEGWDYDTWIDDIYHDKSTDTILKAIVDGFIADNGGTEVSTFQGEIADQVSSYLDLSQMSSYKESWEAMAASLKSKITMSNTDQFNALINSVKHFAGDDYDSFGAFDSMDFLTKLQNNNMFKIDNEIANAVLTAHQNLVKYSLAQQCAENANGLSMFWAVDSNTKYSTNQNIYYKASETNFSIWRTLSNTYGY